VLYIYVIQNHSNAARNWKPYLDQARQGLEDLAASASDVSYAQRYVVVLRELQNEATMPVNKVSRSTARTSQNGPTVQTTADPQLRTHPGYQAQENVQLGAATRDAMAESDPRQPSLGETISAPLGPLNEQVNFFDPVSEPNPLPDFTSWDCFDNFAMAGLGDLQVLFSDEDLNALGASSMVF